MLPVLSVVASAALLKARGSRKHEKEELKRLQEKEQRLEQLLETYKHDLELEQELKAQVEEKLQEVTSEVQELEVKAEQLETEKKELKMQNTVLMLENVILSDTKVKLERKTTELAIENEDLHCAVESLEEENEQAEAMLKKLKGAVGAIFDKYFSSQIDEQDAIKQVKELGLEITVEVPTPRATSSRKVPMAMFGESRNLWEPKLLMDNPERLQRLVAACMTPRSLPGSPSRPAGFPQLKEPTLPAITSTTSDAAPRVDNEQQPMAIAAAQPSIVVSSPSKPTSSNTSKRPTIVSRLALDQMGQPKEKKQVDKPQLQAPLAGKPKGPSAKSLQKLAASMKDSDMDDIAFSGSKDIIIA